VADLARVRQFEYHMCDKEDAGHNRKKIRTHAERYREAVRATHLVASELADIEDDVEFDEMLRFVLTQWRNARQKKRLVVNAKTVDELDHSQTHSLWSEELDPGSGSALASPTAGASTTVFTSPALRVETNSPRPSATRLTPADLAKVKTETAQQSAGEGTFGSDDSDNDSSKSEDGRAFSKFKVRLNPKARKVGRPQKIRTKTVASERADRVWYYASEQARQRAGEVTLVALADALEREKPGLAETQRRLSGVIVKYTAAENKKPKFKTMKNPVLIMDAFYLLPPKLLSACMKLLPQRNTSETAVIVDGEDRSANAAQEVVQVKDVGTFSRNQIETFKRIENLKTAVQLGLDLHKWLLESALPSLPAEWHAGVEEVAERVMATYPYKSIDGLANCPDYMFAMLYRCTPPTWLTDACIRALCDRLVADFPTARYGGVLISEPRKGSRTRSSKLLPLDVGLTVRVQALVQEAGIDTVLFPVNFNDAHWCGIVVKVEAKCIYFYDPLNQSDYLSACESLAKSMKTQALTSFDVVALNNPIQYDMYSCGVFVGWLFVRMVVKGAPRNMSASALTSRRFQLFNYVLTGQLLTHAEDSPRSVAAAKTLTVANTADTVPKTPAASIPESPEANITAASPATETKTMV
jgi:hypothetical protein